MGFWNKLFGTKEFPKAHSVERESSRTVSVTPPQTMVWQAYPSSTPRPSTSIHHSATEGDLKNIEALLKDNPDLVLTKDNYGRTPLHYAAEFGYKDVAELLLANGAKVNAGDIDGRTALHDAARTDHKEVAELLLAKEADPDVRDTHDETPWKLADYMGYKDVAELLLANGAHIFVTCNRPVTTPFHYPGSTPSVNFYSSSG